MGGGRGDAGGGYPRLFEWLLKFSMNEMVEPSQRFTFIVEPRYPFRGSFFLFRDPEAFALHSIRVGAIEQLVAVPVPCAAIHGTNLMLPTSAPGLRWAIEVTNETKKPIQFYAELHGSILVLGEVLPESFIYEGPPSTLPGAPFSRNGAPG